jgi:membrane protease YdiL (CAAX protease family)
VSARRLHAAILLALLGIALGLATCGLATQGAANRAEEVTLAAFGLQLFLALFALAGAMLSRLPVRERLGLGPSRLDGGSLALLVLGILGLSLALDGILDLSGLREQSALSEFDAQLRGIRGRTLLLALLGIGLAPGVAEELLCRGLVQRGLERRLGGPAAIAVAACVFGTLHVEAVHGVLAAALGLYLGTAAYLAGSVRAAIACHAANNLAAVGLTAWSPEWTPASPLAALVGLSLAAGCPWLVWRRAGPPRAAAGRDQGPPGAPGGEGGPGTCSSGLQPGAGMDDP